MIIYYMLGFFVICLVITIWSFSIAESMPDDYDLRPDDIWPPDQKPTVLSEDDYKIFKEHLDNPKEPNTKLKGAAKLYKDGKK